MNGSWLVSCNQPAILLTAVLSIVTFVVVLVLLDSCLTVALWDDASTPVALVVADATYPFDLLLDKAGLSVVLLDRLWPSVVLLDEPSLSVVVMVSSLSVVILLDKLGSSVVPCVEVELGSSELLSESPSAGKKSIKDSEE